MVDEYVLTGNRSLNRLSNLKDAIPNGMESITEKSDNQLCFAFWTCLQLERFVKT